VLKTSVISPPETEFSLSEIGVRPSMASVCDACDNAMCESFLSTLECELLSRRTFDSALFSSDGTISNAILSVEGFPGIGTKLVKVPSSKLNFMPGESNPVNGSRAPPRMQKVALRHGQTMRP
jgi:hypothetical protein